MERRYDYVIVGGGLAGASAVEGIRERDAYGSVLLIGAESHLPYNRPSLSKKLWWGKKRVEEIAYKPSAFYVEQHVDVRLGTRVVELDAQAKTLADDQGGHYRFGKLLLATGGKPRRLAIPGGDLEGVCYYRYLDDYLATRAAATPGRRAVVIGGGFIGSEIAAALCHIGLDVTMLFPGPYLVQKIFPEPLGMAMTVHFREQGIRIHQERPAAIEKSGEQFVVTTTGGNRHPADIVIVGVGLEPETGLAQQAGLKLDDGIVVNDLLATSQPDIYAAGDIARFRLLSQDRWTRMEHWDNAGSQGRQAGRNMTGAELPYDHEPFFFSDLFEFGYEAVGEIDARLATFADWQKENDTGVIYYLRDDQVRGVMMCNVWNKVDEARALLRSDERVTPDSLRGRIR